MRVPWLGQPEERAMKPHRVIPVLLSHIALASCGEDEQPTAPAGPDGAAVSLVATQKVVNSVADPGDGICNSSQCTLREAIADPASRLV
jgi:CSLREA domain-containing protein